MRAERPPAFYALASGGWRDYVTLLHLPYTAWHLSYVAIGAALAPELDAGRLVATLAAFGLAVGVAAHCLDELHGRPLRTAIPRGALVALGGVRAGRRDRDRHRRRSDELGPRFAAFIAVGALAVPAYNLELFGGRLHGDHAFALLWGAFPVLTGYFAQAETLARDGRSRQPAPRTPSRSPSGGCRTRPAASGAARSPSRAGSCGGTGTTSRSTRRACWRRTRPPWERWPRAMYC